jgi:type II secretory pathway component PulC
MKRHFVWVTLTAALVASALGYQNRVDAQDSGDTPAQESTESSQSDSAASAGSTVGQDQSGTSSSGQAGSASGTTPDNQSASTDGAAPQSNTSDPAGAQSATTSNQPSQGTATAPPTPSDPNAVPPPQRPQSEANQQSAQQNDTNENAAQTDVPMESRTRRDASIQQRNRAAFERGLVFGPATNRGLAIRDVEQNSMYFRSGFRRGDVIISLFGRPVRSHADFMRFVIMQPGRPVPVIVLRNGRQQTIYVEYPHEVVHTQHMIDNRAPQASGAYLGVMFDVQARNAAVVLRVNPGGPAERAGIQPRDVILAMNGQEIRSYPEVISMIRRMQPGQEIDIIVGRGQSEAQLSAILGASANIRTATRQADANVYVEQAPADERADIEIDVNRRNNNGRIIDRNNDGVIDRPLLPRLRN